MSSASIFPRLADPHQRLALGTRVPGIRRQCGRTEAYLVMVQSNPRRLIAALALAATLALPGGAAFAADEPASIAATHVVQPGDTISAIAYRYGVPSGDLVQINGL